MLKYLILIILAAGLLSSCDSRKLQVLKAESKAENRRLTQQLLNADKEIKTIAAQRDSARRQLRRMEEQLQGIESQLGNIVAGEHLSVSGNHISVDGLAFNLGSSSLNNQAQVSLHKLAQQLKSSEFVKKQIVVVGHTDNVPMTKTGSVAQYGDNWGLSAMRSASVIRELIKSGVKPQRISGSFNAQYAPRHSNNNSSSRKLNRRVEIFLRAPVAMH